MDRVAVRDLLSAQRRERIHDSFEALDAGEVLVVVNDHDPSPLCDEFEAGVDPFDGDGYRVEKAADHRYVATVPKR
jgi:uncharacterized protein (DUF2249 family)